MKTILLLILFLYSFFIGIIPFIIGFIISPIIIGFKGGLEAFEIIEKDLKKGILDD